MRAPPLDDGLTLDEPPLTVAWSATFAETLARLGRGPVPLDTRTGGRCVLNRSVFLGLPFSTTLAFDATDRLVHARFVPPTEPNDGADPEPDRPEDFATQLERHARSILARRARLEATLGPGGALAPVGAMLFPCPKMQWQTGKTLVLHDVFFIVERGGDVDGWLRDVVEVTRRPASA